MGIYFCIAYSKTKLETFELEQETRVSTAIMERCLSVFENENTAYSISLDVRIPTLRFYPRTQ